MLSSTDFQKVWFLYQTEGAPKGISINSFCVNQGIPHNEFEMSATIGIQSGFKKQ